MKRIVLFSALFTFAFISQGLGQCSPPEFNTQSQIDAFPTDYPGCTVINGGLTIRNGNTPGDEIDDLSPLSGITSVTGALFIRNNQSLGSLAGLEQLNSANTVVVRQNNALTDLSGLNGLTSVTMNLLIRDNDLLENLNGLESLSFIGEDLFVSGNGDLLSLAGLQNLASANNLIIPNNFSLNDLSALSQLSSLGNGLLLADNAALESLNGLQNIISVGGNVTIEDNSLLSMCNFLFTLLDEIDENDDGPGGAPIPDVGGTVTISNNAAGCNNVQEILTAGPPNPTIPTMSEWAFFLLVIMVFTVGIVGVYNVKKRGTLKAWHSIRQHQLLCCLFGA